jgi:hypothetical protein
MTDNPAKAPEPYHRFVRLPAPTFLGTEEAGYSIGGTQAPPPAVPDQVAPQGDELEAFARKLWCRWVGIPITEPYTKEFEDLLGEIRKMHRDAFTRGLREARRQYGKEGDSNG